MIKSQMHSGPESRLIPGLNLVAGAGFETATSGSSQDLTRYYLQARNKPIHAQQCGISRSDTADCNPLALPQAVPIWTVSGHRIKFLSRSRLPGSGPPWTR